MLFTVDEPITYTYPERRSVQKPAVQLLPARDVENTQFLPSSD